MRLLLALIAAATADVHRVPLTKVPRVRQSRTAFSTQQRVAADLKNGDAIIIKDYQNAQYYGPIKVGEQEFKVLPGGGLRGFTGE